MGKVARITQKAKTVAAAADILTELKHNPIRNLVDMVSERYPIPDDPAVLKSLLFTDYEMAYDKDTQKPYLRARLSRRAEIEMELARYLHPRLKASEDASGKGNVGVVVQIKNYSSKKEDDGPIVQVKKL